MMGSPLPGWAAEPLRWTFTSLEPRQSDWSTTVRPEEEQEEEEEEEEEED